MTTTYGQAIIARMEALDRADKVRDALVQAASQYGLATMALNDTCTNVPFRERQAASNALFLEVLRLSGELRDLAVPPRPTKES